MIAHGSGWRRLAAGMGLLLAGAAGEPQAAATRLADRAGYK
jgi:hypothetical protein